MDRIDTAEKINLYLNEVFNLVNSFAKSKGKRFSAAVQNLHTVLVLEIQSFEEYKICYDDIPRSPDKSNIRKNFKKLVSLFLLSKSYCHKTKKTTIRLHTLEEIKELIENFNDKSRKL